MSDTARLLGLPGDVTWQGRTLPVSRITFTIEAHFERYLERRLTAALARARGASSAVSVAARQQAAQAQIAAGELDYESAVGQRAAWSPHGLRELSFWCLHLPSPTWTRADHAALWCDAVTVAQLHTEIRRVSDPLPAWTRPRFGSGRALTRSEWFAFLASDCGLSSDQIGNLDRWQAIALYAPQRDAQGTIQGTAQGPPRLSDEQGLKAWWRARCLPAWRCQAKWDEHRAAQATARAASAGGRRRRG